MKHKKIVATLATLILLLEGLSGAVFAEKAFTLRVGYWPGYGISVDERGELYGYTCDYMKRIAGLNDWEVEFVACGWNDGLEKLRRGEVDVFGPMQKTPEREKIYDYTALRMGDECGAIYVREDNNTIFYNDPASMDGKTLGTIKSGYYAGVASDYCRENGISLQVKDFEDAEVFRKAFEEGTIDLQAAGSMLLPEHAKVVARFKAEDFFFPTTKGNEYVLNGLNRALNEIQMETPYYHAQLYEKYYGDSPSARNALTAGEYAYSATAKPLKIGYVKTRAPFEYQKNGMVSGITPEIMKRVAAYSGMKFEWVPVETLKDALDGVRSGAFDCCSSLVKNEAFAQINSFVQTDALLESRLVFIIKQGNKFDPAKFKLAIPKEWDAVEMQMERNYPNVQIIGYRTMENCLDAVISGEADATLRNALSVDRTLKPQKYRQLSINNMSRGDFPVCLTFPADAPADLLSLLNKSFDTIDSDTRNQAIYQHTIAIPYTPDFAEWLRSNAPFLMAMAMILFLIIGMFVLHAREKLNELAFYDPLTGEMNLTKFKLEAQKRLGSVGKTYAIMVLDIDKFKSVNNLYGYAFGDQLIVLMGKALRQCLLPGSMLCHGTADKFYFFFEHLGEPWLRRQFTLVTKTVEETILREIPTCKVVLSGGICVIRPEDDNIIAIIDRANVASKQVKSFHASSFAYYDQSMYERINHTRSIENEMTAALEKKEFAVYLQPKIDLSTRKIAGAEALVRWIHPEKGLIPPNDFIPLFEENGFIISLDYYMLEQTCQMLERWKKEGRTLFPISVNLSRRHLQEANTAQILTEIVSCYDIPPQLIEIELTESAFDNCNVPSIRALFDELHRNGFTVSVDDFGAGYSSLSLLKDLPIDVLKLDKSFFHEENRMDDRADILLEGVIALSHQLQIRTLSEGVETRRQVELLTRLGCDLVQGYYFARPMPSIWLETMAEPENFIWGSDREGDDESK